MPKQLFTEPELSLVRKWEDARLLENSIKSVRDKYAEMFGKVLDDVQKKHTDLDRVETHLNLSNESVNVGIGKNAWPATKPTYWTSGFWLGGIRIENLTSEDEDAPYKMVLLNHPQGVADLKVAESHLLDAAKRILTKDEVRHLDSYSSRAEANIFVPLGESRECLLELLLTDGARGFIECMVRHFESMMGFTEVLNGMFQESSSKRTRK